MVSLFHYSSLVTQKGKDMRDKEKKSSFLNKLKCIVSRIFVCLFAFGLVLSSTPFQEVKASTHNVTISYTTEWLSNFRFLDYPTNTQHAHGSLIKVDGKMAWCLQPLDNVQTGTNSSVTWSSLGIDQATAKKLSYIAYFGYRENPTTDNRFLTQNLLWEVLYPSKVNTYYYFNDDYPTVKSQRAWRDAVLAKVNKMETKPSFNATTVTLNVGESITLTDSQSILQYYKYSTPNGLTISKSGNKLTITATSSAADSSTIKFTRDLLTSGTGELFAVRNGDSQAISTLYVADPATATLNIKVNKKGSVKITKKDSNGYMIPNTSFKLSYNSNMSNPIGTYTTGSNGTVTINDLNPGTVYIQETSVPNPLILNSAIQSVTIKANETVSFSQTNTYQKGKITARKYDSSTGSTAQGEATLQGAVYGLYAAETMTNPYSGGTYYTKDQLVGERTTNADGTMSAWENLPLGKYYIKEISASKGYQLDTTKYPVELTFDSSVTTKSISVKVYENVITGKGKVTKKDSDTGNTITVPSVFEVYNSSNKLVDTITTSNGSATSKSLPYGNYYMIEKTAPNGYVIDNAAKYSFAITKNGQVATIEAKNSRVTGSISLTKQDSETGTPQGNGTLQGAIYQVIADENILDPSNTATILYQKGAVVKEMTTDRNGKASVTGLYLGKYIIKEKTPSSGYQLDETSYPVTLSYENQTTAVVTKSLTVKENVIRLFIKKVQDDSKVVIPETVFTHTRPDGTSEELTTDTAGMIEMIALEKGIHTLKEKSTIDGYKVNATEIKFSVEEDGKILIISDLTNKNITFDDSTIMFVVENNLSDFEVKIIKTNEKGKLLDGAEFTLYSDADCKNVVATKVSDSGILTFTKLKDRTTYYLKETKAPAGYRIPLDENGNIHVFKIYAEATPVKGIFDFYIDDVKYTVSTSDSNGAIYLDGTFGNQIINMKIINQTGKQLPETGSVLMFPILIIGCGMMIYAIKNLKKNNEENK